MVRDHVCIVAITPGVPPKKRWSSKRSNRVLRTQEKKIFAMDDDVKKRGMEERLKEQAEIIGYDQLVDLILENKVANFA